MRLQPEHHPDSDFARYVDARWIDLVAGLEAEGVEPDDARLAVAEVLWARRRGWERLVADEPVDAHVWAALREQGGLPPQPGGVPPHAVTGGLGGPEDDPRHWFDLARRGRRRRQWRAARLSLVAVVGAALVLLALAWWDARPEPPAVRQEANPLPVTWYSEGELHLADVVVSLPDIVDFTTHGEDVVVRERSGDYLRVEADGDVVALDGDPHPEPAAIAPSYRGPIDRYDLVVQGVALPDGGWAYLLDSARRAEDGDELRRSESGRRAVVVCTVDGECGEPLTVPGGTVRLG